MDIFFFSEVGGKNYQLRVRGFRMFVVFREWVKRKDLRGENRNG